MRTESAIVTENSEVMGNFILVLNWRDLFILKFRGIKASTSREAKDIRNINVETASQRRIPIFSYVFIK